MVVLVVKYRLGIWDYDMINDNIVFGLKVIVFFDWFLIEGVYRIVW